MHGVEHMSSLLMNLTTKMLQKSIRAGLFIDHERLYVHVLASPDGIIICTCCKKGVLEMKCPFCVKDYLPQEEVDSFCMV